MTYQLTLKEGDLIKIKGQVGPFVVVRSEHRVSEDPLRGDSYWVNEIDVVKIRVDEIPNLNLYGTVKSFYFDGGCMKGKGKKIKDSDVLVLGTTKLGKRVQVTYEVTKLKLYGEV